MNNQRLEIFQEETNGLFLSLAWNNRGQTTVHGTTGNNRGQTTVYLIHQTTPPFLAPPLLHGAQNLPVALALD